MNDLNASELPNERIIAIDGTSGSGKSTVARGLSAALGLHILETGSLYRTVTLVCLENNIDVNNEKAILETLENFHFRYENAPFIDSRNVSSEIRSHEVAINVSHVSVHPKVRKKLTQMMRHWIVQHGGGVIEGRDITTVVAPQAEIRVFITAPEEIRAKRRQIDPSDNTEQRSHKEIQDVIAMRDKIDSTRSASPLVKADDVPEIDSSKYDAQTIISAIAQAFNNKQPIKL